MFHYKRPIIIILLLAFCFTITTPAAPTYAFSLSDILSQQTGSDTNTGSGSSIFNILLGLLLGNLLGNLQKTDTTATSGNANKVLPTTSAGGQDIINTAKNYLNVPYVWGGETPEGFDCSGFTQYVMKQNGITLPRTAAAQFASGLSVDKSNLKTGDLVFFTTYKAGASHVGFYISNNQFIHASSSAAKVTISSLDEPYYAEHYIGARRYN